MMEQKKLFIVILLAFMSMPISLAQKSKLHILHSNNTNGALENCYCPDRPYGSVEKRAVYVANYIQDNPNTILLDAGDIFTLTHGSLKDSLMAVAYGKLPYDAILLGDQEMTLSEDRRNQLLAMMDIPALGTNIEGISLPPETCHDLLYYKGVVVLSSGMSTTSIRECYFLLDRS